MTGHCTNSVLTRALKTGNSQSPQTLAIADIRQHSPVIASICQQPRMFEIQLPRSVVVVFVALSSGLWLTTLLLVTGAVCGQREAGRLLSLHDLMAEATSIN